MNRSRSRPRRRPRRSLDAGRDEYTHCVASTCWVILTFSGTNAQIENEDDDEDDYDLGSGADPAPQQKAT